MKNIIPLITLIILFTGCSHPVQPDSPRDISKINARILVYLPESFLHYQSDYSAVIKTISFKFKEPVSKFFPEFLNETFAKVDFTGTKPDLDDNHDFLAVPGFEKVFFDSDRTFGHELRVTVSMTFNSHDNSSPIVFKGTGLAKDMYGGRTVYEKELAEKAFADALSDLQKNIQNRRSEFENTRQ